MKIAAAQINTITGDFSGNSDKIISYCKKALSLGVELVVFPELAICGYPPKSFLKRKEFILKSQEVLDLLIKEIKGIAVITGFPEIKGGDIFNSLILFEDGRVLKTVRKTNLSHLEIFNEAKYFSVSLEENNIIKFKDKNFFLTIGEDFIDFNQNSETFVSSDKNADVIVNISSSPFVRGRVEKRHEILKKASFENKSFLVFSNLCGGNDSMVFDGSSCIFSDKGELLQEGQRFEEDLVISDIDNPVFTREKRNADEYGDILKALETGLRDYVYKSGFSKVLIGLSGGIDSALCAAIAQRALGSKNVHTVFMPSYYTDPENENDTKELAGNLQVKRDVIHIKDAFEVFLNMYEGFNRDAHSIAEQNIQARIRGVFLMGISNKNNSLVIETGNRAEAVVGYTTLYGDLCGAVAPVGDLSKTEVWNLSRYINKIEKREIIPVSIIEKAPSAELKPEQKDQDDLPEYDIVDKIIELYFDEMKSPDEIIKLGYGKNDVKNVLNRFYMNEYKRFQSPPVITISTRVYDISKNSPMASSWRG